ncbi:MAG: hypothetical protein U0168_22610 [Nannocystaceae bacterium]
MALKGERVTVQLLPSGRVTVERTAIAAAPRPRPSRPAAPRPGPAPSSDAARHFGADARAVDPGIDNVVDLRGARADGRWRCSRPTRPRARGRYRSGRHPPRPRLGRAAKAVREHLPSLGHVARQRPGLPEEGGDAVTVVWVR